jgi:protease IV
MESNEIPPAFPPPPPIGAPPPMSPPPLITPSISQRPPGRGRGWMILAIVLLGLLGLSMLTNLGQLSTKAGRGSTIGPRLDEALLENNRSSDKIAVVDIDGVITSSAIDQEGSTMVDVIRAQLELARKDDQVKAVILRVDSPGGEVLASDDIYRAITDFQDRSGKAVIASMGNLAASGGYYVSSPCRWIVANELTITGSIGVIMHTWNYRGLMSKVGLQPEVYKSGKFKDMLSGEREANEIPAEERAMVQSLIDETYSRFKKVVDAGRKDAHEKNKQAGKALAANWQDYADGRILSGTQACELGFVDELGTFQDAVKRARRIAGIKNANLIKYQQRYELGDLFRIFGKTEAPVVKVDLGIETPKLQAGRLYFLSPTFLH